VRATVVAGTLSGVPSTVHAVAAGRSVLASTRAAGTILGRPTLTRGLLVHAGLSAWWSGVLAVVLPRRASAGWGALAGLAIGVLDLGIARRRYPAIDALPRWPQLADHVAFGTLAGLVLGRGDAVQVPRPRRPGATSSRQKRQKPS
jgi:hypothetical protein